MSNSLVKNQQKKAFSLLELSVVLVIISILITGAMAVSVSAVDNAKLNVTKDRMNAIYKALGTYLLKNYRLPCPASLTLAKTSTSYGVEQGATPGNGTCAGGSGIYASSAQTNVIYGAVPVNTLGLPPEMAEDGYGSKIVYIVNRLFTDADYPTASGSGFSYASVSGNDMMLTFDVSTSTTVGEIIMTLISYGSNKYGAYNAYATAQNGASSNSYEQQNYISSISVTFDPNQASFGVNSSYTSRVVITSANVGSDSFDDIVLAKSRNDFVADFNAMFLIPCAAQTVNGHAYASVFYGTQKFSDTGNCTTPSTSRPSYRCGPYGSWSLVDSCVAY